MLLVSLCAVGLEPGKVFFSHFKLSTSRLMHYDGGLLNRVPSLFFVQVVVLLDYYRNPSDC